MNLSVVRHTFVLKILAVLLVLSLTLPISSFSQKAAALDNGLALTPPMGWNSWNFYACNVDEGDIKQAADAMVSSGMKAAGYQYIVIDDCWQTGRTSDGTIIADPVKFPGGMKALADYVHSKGLKFGIYSDAGTQTCQERPGMYGHEVQDANTFASWGVDYVKIDWCHTDGLDAKTRYTIIRDALADTGRPILFSLCNWGYSDVWTWGSAVGNMWRTTGDISDDWGKMLTLIDKNAPLANFAGPSKGWNDADMLFVGNYGTGSTDGILHIGAGMTDTEYRSHFAMWAIMASPLMAGNNMANMNQVTKDILLNKEIIAVDQDPLGRQGVLVSDLGGLQVYSKKLQTSGTRAVVLFNRTGAAANMTVNFSSLGLNASASVRDLWSKTDKGTFNNSYTVNVPSHGSAIVKLTGSETTNYSFVPGKNYRIVPKSTGLSLAVESASLLNGAHVLQWSYGTSQNDQWVISPTTSGFYKISNVKSGKTLAVESASLDNGATVIQWDYGTSSNDQWAITSIGNGYYKIINKKSGKSLNIYKNSLVKGGEVIQWPYSNDDNMTFQLIQLN